MIETKVILKLSEGQLHVHDEDDKPIVKPHQVNNLPQEFKELLRAVFRRYADRLIPLS